MILRSNFVNLIDNYIFINYPSETQFNSQKKPLVAKPSDSKNKSLYTNRYDLVYRLLILLSKLSRYPKRYLISKLIKSIKKQKCVISSLAFSKNQLKTYLIPSHSVNIYELELC